MILILCGSTELINHWYDNSHPLSWGKRDCSWKGFNCAKQVLKSEVLWLLACPKTGFSNWKRCLNSYNDSSAPPI